MTHKMPLVFVDLLSSSADSDYTAAGTEIDLGPYCCMDKTCMAVWAPAWYPEVSTDSDTDCTFDCKLQQSATTVDSDFGDITDAAFTQVTGDSAHAFQSLVFKPTKRYVRTYIALTGTTPSIINYVGLLLQGRFDT